MIYHLLYISRASKCLPESELKGLLKQSAAWNKEHGVTGMLVYVKGIFDNHAEARYMHVIEGTPFVLRRLFDKISRDTRHEDVVMLDYKKVDNRQFKNWEMKFEQIDLLANPELTLFFRMDENILKSPAFKESNIALDFLRNFKKAN